MRTTTVAPALRQYCSSAGEGRLNAVRQELTAVLAIALIARKAKRLMNRRSSRLLSEDEMVKFISEIEAASDRLEHPKEAPTEIDDPTGLWTPMRAAIVTGKPITSFVQKKAKKS